MARNKRKSSSQYDDEDEGDEAEEDDDEGQRKHHHNSHGGGLSFSQMAPEMSQDIAPVKASEQRNLENLSKEEREKVLSKLSRLILFKALAGEPIDRLKCCKEAGIGQDQGKISSAALAEAADRLQNVFGFELKRIPKWMDESKSLPAKYKDRHYVILSNYQASTHNNEDSQDDDGDINDDDPQTPGGAASHSKALYSVHTDVAIEKGFLMCVLGFCFCKGDPRPDGSRWILDADLYRLLNALDENIPLDPPAQGPAATKKKNGGTTSTRRHVGSASSGGGAGGVGMTPDVDRLLEQFVKMDYLMKEKISDDKLQSLSSTDVDEHNVVYALGPRAAVEIGRRQIIYFCADVLDAEPDPSMLLDLERDEEREEEMETIDEE